MTLLPSGAMSGDLAATLALHLSMGLIAGLAIGCAYFALLRRTVDRYLAGGPVGMPVMLTVLRFGGIALALWLLVHWSGAALLAALPGITLARFWVRRRDGVRR